MNIAVASGKGGTGKTTFSVNLAYALAESGERVRLLDCDVEEPNDHLFVRPEFTKMEPVCLKKPEWNEELCTGCGDCARACNYNAIAVVKEQVLIFNELCHSCGVCSYICPYGALTETDVSIGHVESAPENEPFYFAHGTLNIAEALAPAVVRSVKKHVDAESINIIDVSPGTACPVVEAVTDADVAVLVTEPTPFGLNDLKLAVGLSLKRRVPTCIVINRSDGQDELITEYAERTGIPIAGRIPFKRKYAEAYSGGKILTHEFPEFKANMLEIFISVTSLLGTQPPAPPEEERFTVSEGAKEDFSAGTSDTYRETTVISGKGGSGKTTIVSSLAMLSGDKVLADNDVDAADLHLLLSPSIREEHSFFGGEKPLIDLEKCTGCNMCADACHFEAIRSDGPVNESGVKTCVIDEMACEGCGLCQYVCGFEAVMTTPNKVGDWYISETEYGPMAHARLGIAEENSGRLVTKVRNEAARLTRDLKRGLILGDGPPGTGCPVIASVSGADRVLIVSEPTVSGVHDMQRALQLTRHFGVPTDIVINKCDLNREQAERIKNIAEVNGSNVIAEIPFDHNVHDALMEGKTVIEHGKGPAFKATLELWKKLENSL